MEMKFGYRVQEATVWEDLRAVLHFEKTAPSHRANRVREDKTSRSTSAVFRTADE